VRERGRGRERERERDSDRDPERDTSTASLNLVISCCNPSISSSSSVDRTKALRDIFRGEADESRLPEMMALSIASAARLVTRALGVAVVAFCSTWTDLGAIARAFHLISKGLPDASRMMSSSLKWWKHTR